MVRSNVGFLEGPSKCGHDVLSRAAHATACMSNNEDAMDVGLAAARCSSFPYSSGESSEYSIILSKFEYGLGSPTTFMIKGA